MKSDEMRFIKRPENNITAFAKDCEGHWRRKPFYNINIIGIMTRLAVGADDIQGWTRENPVETDASEEMELRRLLFMNHFRHDHEMFYDDGMMQCHTCGIDFRRDKAEDLKAKLAGENHNCFLNHIKTGHGPETGTD